MTLTHVVLFKFKAHVSLDDRRETCIRFHSLKEQCKLPTTGATYIMSMKGGRDNSPEGLQEGLTHGFVMEFASAQDREYYLGADPARLAFLKDIEGRIERAVAVDFDSGVF